MDAVDKIYTKLSVGLLHLFRPTKDAIGQHLTQYIFGLLHLLTIYCVHGVHAIGFTRGNVYI